MADLFVIFSDEKVRGTKLEPVGFSPPAKSVQTFWQHCRGKLEAAAEVDRRKEEELPEEGAESELLIAVCHVARLVAFNLLPNQPWLAAELVSRFTMHGKKVRRPRARTRQPQHLCLQDGAAPSFRRKTIFRLSLILHFYPEFIGSWNFWDFCRTL